MTIYSCKYQMTPCLGSRFRGDALQAAKIDDPPDAFAMGVLYLENLLAKGWKVWLKVNISVVMREEMSFSHAYLNQKAAQIHYFRLGSLVSGSIKM